MTTYKDINSHTTKGFKIRYMRETDYDESKTININLHSRRSVLMDKISEFFQLEKNLSVLLPIVKGESPLSLRVIDFFVTNYARKNEVIYDIIDEKHRKSKFMVHYSYKAQLKAYSKKQFDPFCRRERIIFFVESEDNPTLSENLEASKAPTEIEQVRTTVGQLNFFRWAIKNGILDYIEKHLDQIENDMNHSHRKGKRKRKKLKRNKDKYMEEKGNQNSEDEDDDHNRRDKEMVTKKFVVNTDPSPTTKNADLILSTTKKVNKHNVTITVKFGTD